MCDWCDEINVFGSSHMCKRCVDREVWGLLKFFGCKYRVISFVLFKLTGKLPNAKKPGYFIARRDKLTLLTKGVRS